MPDPLSGASPDTAMIQPTAMAAPDVSEAPMSAPQSPMATPAAQAPGSAPDQQHNFLGRAVRHIAASLEGNSISYQSDPTTGEVQEVQSPTKPGSFFRNLLLGAAIGGAAGANSPNKQSALSGASLGGAAALQQQNALQERQKQQALEKSQRLKNLADANQAKQKEADIQAQTTALGNISVLTHDHMANLHDPKQVDSYNNSSQIVLSALKDKAGARPAQVIGPDGTDLNAKPDNGGDLLAMFNKDPESVMKAPDGWHRSVITTVDTKGLQQKNGQWVDGSGKPADLADRTTFHLLDIPAAKWGQSLTLPKGSINDVAGAKLMSGKDSDTATTTVGQMMSLRLKNLKDLNASVAEMHAPPKDLEEARSWKSWIDSVDKDPNASEADKRRAEVKRPMVESRLSQEEGKPDKPLTAEQDKLQTRNLEKKLTAGTLTPDERTDLIARQQEGKLNGVDSGIASQVGKPPVPSQFPKGENDPAFQAADKTWGKKVTALQTAKGTAGMQLRVQAFEDVPYNVVDTKSGNMAVMTRGELAAAQKQNPGQYLLATQDGLKVMGKQAAIKDIEFNLGNTEKSIGALDNLDTATRAKLAIALRSPDPHSALATLTTSEAKAFSDPKQQDAMIALTSMAENVMLLRSVQGVGGAGSDMMRHALADLVPNATTPSKGYALKQLKVLRRTLDQLKTGVPTTGVQQQATATPQTGKGGDQATASYQKYSSDGKWGWDGKQWIGISK